jgi:purine nucleoside phosphorylase
LPSTPFGPPSAPVMIGEVGGKRVAFLPRHGLDHELPPHRIPYRANVWAMRELGVGRIIGPNASGALKADLELGEFVVCDQFVDRTSGREHTIYDGPETRRDGMHVLWVYEEDDRQWIGREGRNALRYLNHSSSPNAEFDGYQLYALRNIRAGEEITFDYGEEWEDIE